MEFSNLLDPTDLGLYCRAGDFYIDPWRPVDRAVVTHAHGDHIGHGCDRYLTSRDGLNVLRARLGAEAIIEAANYGETVSINGVTVSLHPAGHILGSSQVRVEHAGAVAVVSGDYKGEPDATCAPFEPVRCHVFVSESTFGLPIYRWPSQADVFVTIRDWWVANQDAGRASLLFAYALGKAQRLIYGLGTDPGPIYTHGAVEAMNRAYRVSGVPLPETTYAAAKSGVDWSRALIVAPPSAQGSPWLRRFGTSSTGFASGWMSIRGARRRRSVDRGFVLSDHADWPGLLSAIDATGAEQVWLTHGYTSVVARYLRDLGRDTRTISTRYEGERDDSPAEAAADEPAGTLFDGQEGSPS
ncbi:MAG: ligase-associated DNA damage response exonuclease [Planctomycetia bacterium]|nr:ligase-associated DNA damage response exonuclease [Planctomycetia bacterium]